MESCPLFSCTPPPLLTSRNHHHHHHHHHNNKLALRFLTQPTTTFSNPQTNTFSAALRSPKGFGPPSPKKKKKKKKNQQLKNETKKNIPTKSYNEDEDEDDEEEKEGEDEGEAGVIPEIVTNRMMNRMGFSVGIPLFTGLMFFPFFYYLKVGLKIDVPTWVPFIFSFFFFGTALLGVSYGIVSSSWDPMREGSLLGWNEAQKNWPVFWQSLRGRSTLKK